MPTPTVVITGATAGVGRATAHAFAARGARIALLARGEEGLRDTADEVRARGGTPLTIPTDVSDPDQVERAATQVEAELGPVDVWVNNAMVTVLARAWDVEPDEFRRVVEVNHLGTVNGTLAALRRMRPRDRGSIIQIGSALAFRGIPLQAAYCSSKHAIEGFTESLRTELLAEHSGIHLGIVHLPGMNTPQFTWCRTRLPRQPQPMPPIFQPEVAADGVLWTLDRRREETWVAGSTVGTILGNRVAAKLLARYLARSGIDGQQTAAPLEPRQDNLFSPVAGKHATHGPFDDRARSHSLELGAVERIRRLALAGVAAGAVGLLLARRAARLQTPA